MSVTKRMRWGAFFALALVATLALGGSAYTYAVTTEATNQTSSTNSANTLKVSPVRTDVTVEPGSSKVVKTIITNLTDEEIVVDALENDFVAGDERGTPSLVLDEGEYAPTHSLKRYIEPIGEVTVPANESVPVEVKITVPADAKAGGYFGSVRFAPTQTSGDGQVNLSASVASIILLTVPGDLVEKATMTDFKVQQNGTSSAYFGNGKNLELFTRFTNSGNVQVGPVGKVSVLKGDDVVYETDFNGKEPREVILPDSARRWEVPLKDVDAFGKYTVSATFTYGSSNQTIEATKTFWVIPVAVIAAVVAATLVIIGAIAFAVRKYLKSDAHQRSKSGGATRGR